MNNNKGMNLKKISIFENIIFYSTIIPLIFFTVLILVQRIIFPEEIPNIFGYKLFMILDEKMEESLSYGDLVITKNISSDNLKLNDVIAFRNNTNKVTIHKIIRITEKNDGKQFEMQNSANEIGDTKYIEKKQVEGIVLHRIPNLGLILIKIQEPPIIISLIVVVLIIGIIAYYIAGKLDKRNSEIIDS